MTCDVIVIIRYLFTNNMIISDNLYRRIIEAIRSFKGLSIDCERYLRPLFPQCDPIVLSSIISREGQLKVKANYVEVCREIRRIVRDFESIEEDQLQDDILLRLSVEKQFAPTGLCRLVLCEKYQNLDKKEITDMLKNPNAIPDIKLAINVSKCLMSDHLDGPLTDNIRRIVGEEYEILLKKKAREAGLVFYDEGDLRRTGYDKTPDLKLALPCLYKGVPIHWIESKASFGDMDSHQKYIKDQLSSYGNRFGAGIIIYWFGFLESILRCCPAEDSNVYFVMDKFPQASELELLKVDP